MSALGQKQTFDLPSAMSALPPRADILRGASDVRFVPIVLQKSDAARPHRPSHRGALIPESYLKFSQDWSSAVGLNARRNGAPPTSRLALGVRNLMTVDGRTANDVVMYWM